MGVINEFIEAAKKDELTYKITLAAVSKYQQDRATRFWDSPDETRRQFYKDYVEFARQCKELGQLGGVSGYGGIKDYEKIRIKEMCRGVDYTFPYGWK